MENMLLLEFSFMRKQDIFHGISKHLAGLWQKKPAVHAGQESLWFIWIFSSSESEKEYRRVVSDAFIIGFPNLPYVDQTPVKTVYLWNHLC